MRKMKSEYRNLIVFTLYFVIIHVIAYGVELYFSTSGQHLAIIVDAIMGLVNQSKANKINTKRPTYNIPKEIFQNQAMYQAMANSSRVPGQSYIENNIGQAASQAINASQRSAGSSAEALAAIGGIQQNQSNMFNELGMAGAQYQMANRDKLAMANETMADYRQQEFDYNRNQPYQIRMAQKQKYQDQAYQNWTNIGGDVHEFGMSMGTMGMGSSSGGSRSASSSNKKQYTGGVDMVGSGSSYYG